MLSISTGMSAGKASSYHAKDDYYLKQGGIWHGQGAIHLGLQNCIEKTDFQNILFGKNQSGTEQLISKKTDSIDANKDRAAIDLTFSAPKSVSILAVSDSHAKKAHDTAVSATLDYIEKHLAQTREQLNGDRKVLQTGNLVIAKMDHIVSRELDPNLHTHCLVMNMTQKPDGTWRSLHNDTLYTNKMALGRIYRNQLAVELQKAGYQIDITDHRQSFFEVKGIDPGLIMDFSTRRNQVLATSRFS